MSDVGGGAPGAPSVITAYALLLIGGAVGWHRLYLGEAAEAILYGQTFAYGGSAWLLDLVRLRGAVARARAGGPARDDSVTLFAVTRMYAVAMVYAFLAGWLAVYDGGDPRDIEHEPTRLAVFAAQAVAAALGAALAAAASGGRPGFFAPAALALAGVAGAHAAGVTETSSHAIAASGATLGVTLGALVTVYRRGRGAVPPPPPASARPVAPTGAAHEYAAPAVPGDASAATRRGKTEARGSGGRGCGGGGGGGSRPRSLCAATTRLCGVAAAQALFWTVVASGLLLHADVVPVDARGRWHVEGLRTAKLGPYAWEHRAELWGAGARLLEQGAAYVRERGWEGVAREARREWAARAESDHAVLGVPRTADGAAIRAAYRRLAKELHPDRLPPGLTADERAARIARFRRVQAAYEALTSTAARGGRGRRGRDAGGAGEAAGEAGESEL